MTEQEKIERYDQFNLRVHAKSMKFLADDQEKFVRIELHPICEDVGSLTGLSRMIEVEAEKHFYIWGEDY